MHRKSPKKALFFLCIAALSYSCIDKNYDLDKVEKFVLPVNAPAPIAYMERSAMELLTRGGLHEKIFINDAGDTIFIAFEGTFNLDLDIPDIPDIPEFGLRDIDIWSFATNGVLYLADIPANLAPYITPYLENIPFNVADKVQNISVFKDMAESKLKFSNPVMNLRAKNYTGYTVGFNINSIKALNSATNDAAFAYFEPGHVKNLYFNVVKAENINFPAWTFVQLNKDHGDTDGLLAVAPDELIYDFRGGFTLPPQGGFLIKDKYMDVDYEVKLPFAFEPGTEIVDTDTLDLDLSKMVDLKDITKDSLILYVSCKNKVPAAIELMLTFLDKDYGRRTSITGNAFKELVEAPEVDAKGYAKKETDGDWVAFRLTAEQIDFILNDAKYLEMKYRLYTNNKATIHSKDFVQFKIAVWTKIGFEI